MRARLEMATGVVGPRCRIAQLAARGCAQLKTVCSTEVSLGFWFDLRASE